MTQNEKILRHMKTHKKGITPIVALQRYGCMRLSARIADLRQMGYDIKSELVCVKNREGEVCRVSQYTLEA